MYETVTEKCSWWESEKDQSETNLNLTTRKKTENAKMEGRMFNHTDKVEGKRL
jgi:hypothetical protein